MDLINPNESDKSFLQTVLTDVNPLVVVPPKTGAFAVGIIDLVIEIFLKILSNCAFYSGLEISNISRF